MVSALPHASISADINFEPPGRGAYRDQKDNCVQGIMPWDFRKCQLKRLTLSFHSLLCLARPGQGPHVSSSGRHSALQNSLPFRLAGQGRAGRAGATAEINTPPPSRPSRWAGSLPQRIPGAGSPLVGLSPNKHHPTPRLREGLAVFPTNLSFPVSDAICFYSPLSPAEPGGFGPGWEGGAGMGQM